MSDQTSATAPLSQELRQQQEQMIRAGLEGPFPKFYANSVGIAHSASDVSLVLFVNSHPVCSIQMSYISAKSLLVDLRQAVDLIESATGQTIKTISEISNDLQLRLGAPG